ncbi:MAG: hypothetical protein AAGE01_12640, partial [Pseudomonadota bacterium]
PQLAPEPVTFDRESGQVSFACGPERQVRLALVGKLLGRLPEARWPLAAEIDTGAFFDRGAKIGLGSSAAVAAAFVRAAEPAWGQDAVFAEALAGHRAFQSGQGSGADVAASVYGGVIGYRRGVASPARSLAMPSGLHWRAVWTRRSADTREFLARLGAWQEQEPAAYDRRMGRLLATAEAAVTAFEEGSADAIMDVVDRYRSRLAEFGERAGLSIVSPIHARLAEAAAAVGVAYKPSGAGGGDFGIAFSTDPDRLRAFDARLDRLGAHPVKLAIDAGARLEADPQPQGL